MGPGSGAVASRTKAAWLWSSSGWQCRSSLVGSSAWRQQSTRCARDYTGVVEHLSRRPGTADHPKVRSHWLKGPNHARGRAWSLGRCLISPKSADPEPFASGKRCFHEGRTRQGVPNQGKLGLSDAQRFASSSPISSPNNTRRGEPDPTAPKDTNGYAQSGIDFEAMDIGELGSSTAKGHQEQAQTVLKLMRNWKDTFPELHNAVKPEQILFLNCLNKNLTERDFLRTICDDSKGQPFARVIPIRDVTSLEKTDSYIVIFHDRPSLEAWRAHLSNLGHLSHRYTMRSLSHPEVVPQRDFSVKGEKVDQLVKSYALRPSGTWIATNYDPDWIDPRRNTTAQAGGHGGIVSSQGERRNGVLLRITGVHNLTLADLLQSIVYDGKRRNMAWTILLSTKSRFSSAVPWDAELRTRRSNNQAAGARKAAEAALGSEQMSWNEESAAREASRFASANAIRYYEGERWIIYFHDAIDAQRFARTWHRRPMPLPPSDDTQYKFSEDVRRVMDRDGGASIKVYAEALW